MGDYDLTLLEAQLSRIEGAVRRKRRPKAKRVNKSRRTLVRRQYTKDRGFLLRLGYRHAFDDPNGRTIFIANPQIPVRPRRLVIAEWHDNVGNFGGLRTWGVVDIKIANRSQFVDGGAQLFPASAFLPEASEILFKFDSCGPGEEIAVTLEIINSDRFPSTDHISAGMICHAADK